MYTKHDLFVYCVYNSSVYVQLIHNCVSELFETNINTPTHNTHSHLYNIDYSQKPAIDSKTSFSASRSNATGFQNLANPSHLRRSQSNRSISLLNIWLACDLIRLCPSRNACRMTLCMNDYKYAPESNQKIITGKIITGKAEKSTGESGIILIRKFYNLVMGKIRPKTYLSSAS